MKKTHTLSVGEMITSWTLRKAVLVVAMLLLFVMGSVVSSRVSADDNTRSEGERLVTIFDRGIERSFMTRTTTIGDALAEADVEIDERDRVEPGLDEALVADEYTVNVYRARPVLVIDGQYRTVIMTAAQVRGQIADDAGITLYDEDETRLEQSDNVLADQAAERFVVARATPFTLTLYGKTFTARTKGATVDEMLKEKGIVLGKNDRISTSKNTTIHEGMKLRVWREGKQTITKDEKIAFEVEQIQDANRPVGYRSVKTPGVKGERTVTYEVLVRDGKEVKRKEIASVTKKKAQKQVEVIGAKPSFSGDFAAALAKLRSCEGGYNSWNPSGPYYGAYQFDKGTWNSVSSAPYGSATPAEQDAAARVLYERRGWQPWPSCGANLPDTYR